MPREGLLVALLVACGGAPPATVARAPVCPVPTKEPPKGPVPSAALPAVNVPVFSAWASRVTVDDVLDSRDGRSIATRFPRRASLASARTMRFTADGEPFVGDGSSDELGEAIVVEENEEGLRLVVGNEAVRLVVLLDRAEARVVTNERVLLTTTPHAAAGEASVGLASGVPVRVVERSGSSVRVTGNVDGVVFFGWLPAEEIGWTFLPGSSPKPVVSDGELDWGATVASTSGVVVARFPDFPSFPSGAAIDVRLVGAPVAGRQAIAWSTDRIEVRGLVDAALVRRRRPTATRTESGSSVGVLGFESDTIPVTLARGARLFTRDGFRIGLVLRRVEGFAAPTGGALLGSDLCAVDVEIDGLGFVGLYVRAADIDLRAR